MWRATGFGLAVHSHQSLLPPSSSPSTGEPVQLKQVQVQALARAWEGSSAGHLWQSVFPDGRRVTAEEGPESEQRIVYGDLALYEISADGHELSWGQASADEADAAAVQRFLLDTGLWWTSMTLGFELLHASAVTLPGERLVAVVGPSGSGKTSLAIALIAHGAALFADDVLALRRHDAGVLAYPGPALMNVPDASLASVKDWTTAIASFPDQGESWVAVARAATEPASLSAAIVLDRSAQSGPEVTLLAPSRLTLMGYGWGLANTGERRKSSFEVFADLAESVPTYHLSARADVSPKAAAQLIIDTLCG